MTIELATLISVISILIAIATFFLARKKEAVNEVKEDNDSLNSIKEALLKANMKLDAVCATTTETRTDIKSMQKNMNEYDKRLTLVEAELGKALDRIEKLEGK